MVLEAALMDNMRTKLPPSYEQNVNVIRTAVMPKFNGMTNIPVGENSGFFKPLNENQRLLKHHYVRNKFFTR